MHKMNLTRLKRIEQTQNSRGLDPETEQLFDPLFAVILFHILLEKYPDFMELKRDDVFAALDSADAQRLSSWSDAELHSDILHGNADSLDRLFIASGAAPRNGRDLNAWVQSPATVKALGAMYDAIPAAFKQRSHFPNTMNDHLKQARKSAARMH